MCCFITGRVHHHHPHRCSPTPEAVGPLWLDVCWWDAPWESQLRVRLWLLMTQAGGSVQSGPEVLLIWVTEDLSFPPAVRFMEKKNGCFPDQNLSSRVTPAGNQGLPEQYSGPGPRPASLCWTQHTKSNLIFTEPWRVEASSEETRRLHQSYWVDFNQLENQNSGSRILGLCGFGGWVSTFMLSVLWCGGLLGWFSLQLCEGECQNWRFSIRISLHICFNNFTCQHWSVHTAGDPPISGYISI